MLNLGNTRPHRLDKHKSRILAYLGEVIDSGLSMTLILLITAGKSIRALDSLEMLQDETLNSALLSNWYEQLCSESCNKVLILTLRSPMSRSLRWTGYHTKLCRSSLGQPSKHLGRPSFIICV